MENKITKWEPQTVRGEVVKQMEAMQASKFIALPENYKQSAFFAIEKLANLQDIEKVPPMGVTKALISMFNNKLDFQKNHCYFFVQNDKNSETGKSLRFGWQYQGLMFVAKDQCEVLDVIPVLVHQKDEVEKRYENGNLIIVKHIPTFEGEIVGGYCVVKQSGENIIKYYTRAELDKRRDKSMAKNGQFWNWEREMYEKTLINAVLKRIIETSANIQAENLYAEPDAVEPRKTIEVEVVQQPEPQTEPEQGKIKI
jgi:recombinational DNA repair protein RecT